MGKDGERKWNGMEWRIDEDGKLVGGKPRVVDEMVKEKEKEKEEEEEEEGSAEMVKLFNWGEFGS